MLGKHRHLFVVEQIGQQSRHKRRLKLFLPVTIATQDAEERAHLLDLSKVGARLHAHITLQRDQDITIHYGSMAIHATIVWVKGNGLGVLFHGSLTQAQIETLLSGH